MHLNSKKYRPSTWYTVAIIIIFTAVLNNSAFATPNNTGSANFSWLPNSESDLAGYKIRYGTSQNGPYDFIVDVGNPAPVDGRVKSTVSGLSQGVTYFFIAIAYNQTGLESDYSAEATYTCPPPQADVTPPVGTILISAGTADTTDPNVTLTLSASDTESNVAQMKFSNNNVYWSIAETYNTSKGWILSEGSGIKTVYVNFKDAAGNWSSSYSDTIELTSPEELANPNRLRIVLIKE